jgi:predicted component of type VI protein secretion system
MSVFLIAQTPRAGEENHCIIAPCLLPISEREVFQRISMAIYQPEGKDYLAVSQTVEQTGSARHGREILVLVGINVNKLSATQRDKLQSTLKHYLFQFETLVTQTIDWNKENSALLVYRPELDIWKQDTVFSHLPQTRDKFRFFKRFFQKDNSKCVENQQTTAHKPETGESALITQNTQSANLKSSNSKVWILVLMIGVTIAALSLEKYLKRDRQIPTPEEIITEKTKTSAKKVLVLLKEHGLSVDEHNDDKAIDELYLVFCGKNNHFSNCYELPDGFSEVNRLITKWVEDETSLNFLKTQLKLDEVDSLDRIVEIRHQLRQLDTVLTHIVHRAVYIPLLTHEDVNIVKRLQDNLASLQPDQKIADYLDENYKTLALRVKSNSLLTHWDEHVFSSTKQRRDAENELEKLLSNLCGESVECQLEKLDEYNQAQSIQNLIGASDEDKRFISAQLGFDEMTKVPEPEQIVEIRNALRGLNARLNDNKPKRVFLPLFNQEDATIISTLAEEFELKDTQLNLVEGLRTKLKRKPYRFFRNKMKMLIKKVEASYQ